MCWMGLKEMWYSFCLFGVSELYPVVPNPVLIWGHFLLKCMLWSFWLEGLPLFKSALSLLSFLLIVKLQSIKKSQVREFQFFFQHIFPAPVSVLEGPSQCLVQFSPLCLSLWSDTWFRLKILAFLGSCFWSLLCSCFEDSDLPTHPWAQLPKSQHRYDWGLHIPRIKLDSFFHFILEGDFWITLALSDL